MSPPVGPSADGQAGGDGVGDHAVTDTGPAADRAAPLSRAGVVLAVVAVVLVVVLAIVALLAGETGPHAASDAGATPVATDTIGTLPGPLVGPTTPPTSAADPSPTTVPAGDRSPDTPAEVVDPNRPSAPEPLIHPFAQLPGATPEPKLAGPPASLPRQVEADGCDRHYGEVTQCIPLAFPPGVTEKCEWLQTRGYGPLAVHGEDRQALDPDGDGTACGPGD